MEPDKEREILKDELEKTTAKEGIPHREEKEAPKKVGVGVRTYAADIADIMRKEKGSVIKIALAEQERRKAYQEKKDPTSTKNLIVIFIGIIFIVAGIMIFVYSIMNRSKPATISYGQSVLPGLFYTENQTQTDITNLTRGNFFNAIHSNVDASFAENDTITNVVLTAQIGNGRGQAPVGLMFNKLGIKVPENVLNTFTGSFMLGTYKKADKGNMFLVIKIKEYNESFSAMRSWEVSMLNDLVRLFRINSQDFTGNIFLKDFRNAVIFNKDARALYDENGQFVFAYIYVDRSTIMLTTYMPVAEEVIKRMNVQSIR